MDTRETAQVNELVQAAKAGDDEALRQLIAWAMEYLFPAVLSLLGERHVQGTYVTDAFHQSGPDLFERMQDDAWAITHASCCRMATKLPSFRGRSALGRPVQFGTWLYAIARNEMRTLLRDRWRERKRRLPTGQMGHDARTSEKGTDGFREGTGPTRFDTASAEPEQLPEQLIEAKWERELLREALERAPLTPEQKQAVLLFHVLGWRQERIAAATGVQIGTVKKRIFDGLRKLRTYMQERSAAPPKRQGRESHG